MKTAIIALTSLAIAGANLPSASASDREWATAGKILTGVVAGSIIAKTFESAPAYVVPVYTAPSVVVTQPVPPAPVYVHPAPVVVYQQPVCVVPPPVGFIRPAPAVNPEKNPEE